MEIDTALEECSLVDRVVLLGVIAAAETGETPVRMDAVRSICNESFTESTTGRLAESDVARALNVLAATDLVGEVDAGGLSPTGKGRPAYELQGETEPILEALAGEEQLEELVVTIEG